jgi:hypothetical protein
MPQVPTDHEDLHTINLFQHNCAGSKDIFKNLFATLKNKNPHILVFQDTLLQSGKQPIVAGFMAVYPSKLDNQKIRAVTYISTNLAHISFMPVFYDRDDIVGVNFHFNQGFQGSKHKNHLIINAYNSVVKAYTTIPPYTLFSGHRALLVIVTDNLNIHHILTQLDRKFNKNESNKSNPFFDKAYNKVLTCANKPGVITRWSDSLSK